jgi:hypothetical protein
MAQEDHFCDNHGPHFSPSAVQFIVVKILTWTLSSSIHLVILGHFYDPDKVESL